jgi:ribA/ribD-fused uncharacterized protein
MLTKAALMNDIDLFNELLNIDNPAKCKLIGRALKNFNQELWDKYIEDIAYNVLYQKFSSSEELKLLLVNTNDSIIAEATEKDKIWECGININDKKINDSKEWLGKNILGFSLIKVRNSIK